MTSSARPRHEADPAIDAAVLDDLVRRVQRGELAAFNSLVLRYQNALYSLVARMLTDRAEAEDVTQEAFVAAWRNIGTFRGGSFCAWLFTIAANRARDEIRRRVRRPTTSLDAARDDPDRADLDPPDRDPTPEGVAEQTEMRAALEVALRELPDDWREVVVATAEIEEERAGRPRPAPRFSVAFSGFPPPVIRSRRHPQALPEPPRRPPSRSPA